MNARRTFLKTVTALAALAGCPAWLKPLAAEPVMTIPGDCCLHVYQKCTPKIHLDGRITLEDYVSTFYTLSKKPLPLGRYRFPKGTSLTEVIFLVKDCQPEPHWHGSIENSTVWYRATGLVIIPETEQVKIKYIDLT